MSFDLLRSAKHIRGLSNAEFRVLFYLLEAANNNDHRCFPSIKKIAAYTDMAERTVQRHISALADRGLFERIEQRRNDGSRMVNCYRFVIGGTVKIGKESVVQLLAGEDVDADYQPAENGTLSNPPFLTGGGVNSDTTPRQSRRDIDQESEPGIESPPFPNGKDPPQVGDLFGGSVKEAVEEESLVAFVERRWAEIVKANDGRIANIRKIDDGLKHTIELRAKQHARDGESPVDVWKEALLNIAASRFLCGQVPPGPGRDTPFRLSLAWACKAQNFREILNGSYNRDRDPNLYDARTGRRLGPTDAAVAATLERMRAPGAGGAGRRDSRSVALR